MNFIARPTEYDKDICKQTKEDDFQHAELTLQMLGVMSLEELILGSGQSKQN